MRWRALEDDAMGVGRGPWAVIWTSVRRRAGRGQSGMHFSLPLKKGIHFSRSVDVRSIWKMQHFQLRSFFIILP